MPNPLLSFRLEPELLDALDRFAQDNGLDRTTVIRSAISLYINAPASPIEGRLAELEELVMAKLQELDERLEKVEAGTLSVHPPADKISHHVAADSLLRINKIESTIAELRQPVEEGDGISQNELMRLCQCGDQKLKKLRDRPEELAAFALERTGQAYEYRNGRYFSI